MNHELSKIDPKINSLLRKEESRQRDVLEMIPSENFVSQAVLSALGSVATNKYAEGYPGKRYYGGCENIDEIESLAIERAKKLFKAEHANVQPHSGAPANMAAYRALLKPGDTVLGMDLSHGGHLTHGHPITQSAEIYKFIGYKTAKNGQIDYNELERLAKKHKPKLILVGFSAYSREINYKKIKLIADKVNARTMADIAHIAGLIAAGELKNPVPIFDVVTTTTHKTLRGPRGGIILCKAKFASAIDKAVFPGLQGGPHENVITAKAVAFKEASTKEFKKYARQVIANAKTLEMELHALGFNILFGGTQNHMLLIDVTNKGLTGAQAESALNNAGITVNRNMIPNDTRKPLDPSGIRLGTPAITTRGMKEKEMKQIAKWIDRALTNDDNKMELARIKKEVKKMTSKFGLFKS